jgi:hypothetical protein
MGTATMGARGNDDVCCPCLVDKKFVQFAMLALLYCFLDERG